DALLIDEDCLRSLENNKSCGPSVTLAYRDDKASNVKHKQTNGTIARYEDDPAKDYLLFRLKDHKRALVRFNTTSRLVALSDGRQISVAVPDSIPKFLRHWKRGRFMQCKPVLERAGDVKRALSLSIVNRAVEFRDLCDEYGMTPFLACGSLLGWYRECSVIPHTQDFDFAAFREEHSDELDRWLRQSIHSNSTFRLKYVYGRLHEAREYTVGTDVGRIDLFYMYPDKGQHYIAEMGFGRLQQLRYYYPKIEELCTGDLHGRLMFLPCNALEVIKVEHGEHWNEDIQSNKFYENRDHLVNNLKHVRYYASTEYPEVYQKY
ncbi:Fukutin, partial [Aphelenchoides avenae]